MTIRTAEHWYGTQPGVAPEYDRAPSWRDEAACKGVGPEPFFPPGDGVNYSMYAEARSYCNVCPVIHECLEDALAMRWRDEGFRAGLTARQRDEMRRARSRLRSA